MLRQVDDLPESGGKRTEPFAARDVREFLRKRMDVAIVEVEGKKPEAIKKSATSYIRKKGIEGVEAVQRAGKCYLYRTMPYPTE